MVAGPGPPSRAAVLGTTAWGTTLAILLTRNGVPTTLLARTSEEAALLGGAGEHAQRLPGVAFPAALQVAAGDEARAALAAAELVCVAVPSVSMPANLELLKSSLPTGTTIVSATKGIEVETGQRMSELITSALPGRPLAVLSGPNLSHEVAAGLPGTTVIASATADLQWVRSGFHSAVFRVYTSNDVVGVELGGALKNIVAIAAGVVDALHYGDNAKGALIARGLAEITRLGVASGADPLTFQGLAGVGDAIATSYSPLSRNRRLGELLGGGATLEDALATIGETAEGARTIPAALLLASRFGVELPITQALQAMLYEGLGARAAVEVLLGREPTAELRSAT